MKHMLYIGCLGGTLLLVGCQTPFDDSLYQQWQQSQAHASPITSASSTTSDIAPSDLFSDPLSLTDMIDYAQSHNPTIEVARHRIEQARQTIPQVTSLDDPMFTVAPVGRMAQTADGEVGPATD